MKTNGRYVVTFNLKKPQSTWQFILATGAAGIVPSNVYKPNRLQGNSEPQIGTGPYKLTRYTPGQQAVFEPFDDYWGPAARNDGLIIRYYSKSSTMKLALERGEIDMAFQTFTPTELTSLGKAEGVRVYQGQGAVIRYLVMNVAREPFNNLNVRRALAYMMPRAAIAARVYRGNVKPLYSMPPAGLPGHIDAFAARYGRAPNIAAAKRELQRAGVSTPMPIEIWWTPTHYGDASADEYAEMKRGLERGGVFKVTLKSSEWAQYSGVLGTQYNAFQLGWFPDYPDPENYVLSFYQSGNFTENGYSNPKMTRLLKPRAGSHHDCKAARCDQADPAAGGAGRADHPVLAEQHDRGRPLERARNPDHARRCVHHAVLEDLEEVSLDEGRRASGAPRSSAPTDRNRGTVPSS